MQHAKRELNKQKRYKTGNKNGLNLYSQKNKQTKKDLNTKTVHLVWGREREQNWVTVCTHLKK